MHKLQPRDVRLLGKRLRKDDLHARVRVSKHRTIILTTPKAQPTHTRDPALRTFDIFDMFDMFDISALSSADCDKLASAATSERHGLGQRLRAHDEYRTTNH